MCDAPCGPVWLMAVLAAAALTGCAAPVGYPADWSPMLDGSGACELLVGSFADKPSAHEGSARQPTLNLKEVFFGRFLQGFEVTHLGFELLEGGKLQITPWVGEVKLREARVLDPPARGCASGGWVVDAGWEGDGYSTATAAFMTAGMLMPLASKTRFSLSATLDGQLVVHARQDSVNALALVVPFRTRDAEDWFVYSRFSPESGRDEE